MKKTTSIILVIIFILLNCSCVVFDLEQMLTNIAMDVLEIKKWKKILNNGKKTINLFKDIHKTYRDIYSTFIVPEINTTDFYQLLENGIYFSDPLSKEAWRKMILESENLTKIYPELDDFRYLTEKPFYEEKTIKDRIDKSIENEKKEIIDYQNTLRALKDTDIMLKAVYTNPDGYCYQKYEKDIEKYKSRKHLGKLHVIGSIVERDITRLFRIMIILERIEGMVYIKEKTAKSSKEKIKINERFQE